MIIMGKNNANANTTTYQLQVYAINDQQWGREWLLDSIFTWTLDDEGSK